MFADSLHRRGFYLGTRPASQGSLWLPVWSGPFSCRAHPRAPLCSLCVKVMDAEDAEGPSATAKLGPRSSGVQGGMRKAWPPLRGNPKCVCVASLRPPPSLGSGGHLPPGRDIYPGTNIPPHTALRGSAAYSKSPSRYLPKAWRITVLTAMSGFTTQNCRVACGGKAESGWGQRHVTSTPLARKTYTGCQAVGEAQCPPPGDAVWRKRQNR